MFTITIGCVDLVYKLHEVTMYFFLNVEEPSVRPCFWQLAVVGSRSVGGWLVSPWSDSYCSVEY